jgi:Tol biopolymer transport system component
VGWSLHVKQTGSENLLRLTPDGRNDHNPAWSPDGTRIVFGRENPSPQQFAMFVVNVNGSGLHQVSGWQLDFGSASWSPDGQWVLTDNGQGGLYVVHPDGTGEQQIMLRRDAELQVRVLIETSPLAILTLDHAGRVLLANESASELLEFDHEELQGQAKDDDRHLPCRAGQWPRHLDFDL